jgi:hypothetical protein
MATTFPLRDISPFESKWTRDVIGTVKNAPGFLHAVTINDVEVAGALWLYDDTDAATGQLASINVTTRAAGAQIPITLIYDVPFGTALTFNANNGLTSLDVTFSYA